METIIELLEGDEEILWHHCEERNLLDGLLVSSRAVIFLIILAVGAYMLFFNLLL